MKRIWILAFSIAALVSCTGDQLPDQSLQLVPLSLSGNTSGISVTPTTKSSVNLNSAVVGAYVLQTDATPASTLLTAPFVNVFYSVDAVGVFSTLTDVQVNNTKNYSVLGYAPYKNVTNVTTVSFSHGEDVLYAPATPVTILKTSASVVLPFTHKMSRITFKIVPGLHNPDITGAALSVSGFYSSCTMNLNDGSLTPVMGEGVTITAADNIYCIVPGELNLNITVTIGSRKYAVAVPFIAEPAKDYTYTLKINEGINTPLGVDCQVVDWCKISAGDIPDLQ